MTDAQLIERLSQRGDTLYRTLKVTTICSCRYNVPYADSAIKREVVQVCQRCLALAAWEKCFDRA